MIPRSTWSRPGARETGPRRARGAVEGRDSAACERLRNTRRSYHGATQRVNRDPSFPRAARTLTFQVSGQLHADVLDPRVLLHRVDRHVLPVARLLEPAVRHLRGEREE